MYNSVDLQAKDRLFREVGDLLVGHGYATDGSYWRRRSEETIASLFIENYRASYSFYVSLGVFVIGLGEKQIKKPKLRDMHAWTRLSQLTPVTTRPQLALKGDGSEDTNRMVDEVLTAIRLVGLEVLSGLLSLDGTDRVLRKYGDMRWSIGPLLKERLYGNPKVIVSGELPIQQWEIDGSRDPFHDR